MLLICCYLNNCPFWANDCIKKWQLTKRLNVCCWAKTLYLFQKSSNRCPEWTSYNQIPKWRSNKKYQMKRISLITTSAKANLSLSQMTKLKSKSRPKFPAKKSKSPPKTEKKHCQKLLLPAKTNKMSRETSLSSQTAETWANTKELKMSDLSLHISSNMVSISGNLVKPTPKCTFLIIQRRQVLP